MRLYRSESAYTDRVKVQKVSLTQTQVVLAGCVLLQGNARSTLRYVDQLAVTCRPRDVI